MVTETKSHFTQQDIVDAHLNVLLLVALAVYEITGCRDVYTWSCRRAYRFRETYSLIEIGQGITAILAMGDYLVGNKTLDQVLNDESSSWWQNDDGVTYYVPGQSKSYKLWRWLKSPRRNEMYILHTLITNAENWFGIVSLKDRGMYKHVMDLCELLQLSLQNFFVGHPKLANVLPEHAELWNTKSKSPQITPA